jgi:hypothetical protein
LKTEFRDVTLLPGIFCGQHVSIQDFSQINPDQGSRKGFIPEILQIRSVIFFDPDFSSNEHPKRPRCEKIFQCNQHGDAGAQSSATRFETEKQIPPASLRSRVGMTMFCGAAGILGVQTSEDAARMGPRLSS